jgi:DNA adenine methylase
MPLKSPYPWFGVKSAAASIIWEALGDVYNYVEPFFGSGTVLLSRPHEPRLETINDADGFVSNFWRSIQADPDAVAYWADSPVSEIDLFARHSWLVNRKERLLWSLEDPDFYDAEIAGWWVWGISCWIGGGFCSGNGPWKGTGAHIVDSRKEPAFGAGINCKRLTLREGGRGINRPLPHLSDTGQGINRQLPSLTNRGRGIHQTSHYIAALSERMRRVRVCCGDWSRIMGPSVLVHVGLTGVVLDPPYAAETGRSMGLYSAESGSVSHEVRKWCIENGDNMKLRIVLCGYDGEHDMPDTWRCVNGKAKKGVSGGYGAMRKDGTVNENGAKERLWLSPACLTSQPALI